MLCPNTDCKRVIQFPEIDRICDSAVKQKYQQFMLEAHLKNDPDCRWCPKPRCGMAMIGSKDRPMMRCPNDACRYTFCFNCRVEWHSDTTCEKYQEWKRD